MKNLKIFLVLLLIVFGLSGCNQLQQGKNGQKVNKQNCLADGCLLVDNLEYPVVAEVGADIKVALEEAIEDEYKAWSTYDAVIEKFGKVRPFIMIIRAEEQHIASLKALFDKYGFEIPENSWQSKVQVPESLSEACAIGVEAEIANADLYQEKLIPVAEGYEDIVMVFNNLMSASEN